MDKVLASIVDKLEEKNEQSRHMENFELRYLLVLFCSSNICLSLVCSVIFSQLH